MERCGTMRRTLGLYQHLSFIPAGTKIRSISVAPRLKGSVLEPLECAATKKMRSSRSCRNDARGGARRGAIRAAAAA